MQTSKYVRSASISTVSGFVLGLDEDDGDGAVQGDGQSEDTGLRASNVMRPEKKSPARDVEYFKNKQDIAINEVEVNQSVYVY